MSYTDGVFSLRIVIADFFMEKPVHGLDPCYSEFRGKEIKRVPVIRIFGSNAQGQKTCMHIHGVFPYFYIPYDKKDFESTNQAIYQIAINIDKALNISLNQGSSTAQHVFKVQLVKGIPFYGYHRSDHQFLKIYMFNPRFVRRASNLLQNGAILNKNFSPHESHVPYILQFMIDYNLYGMSFLHAPLEIVKFRRSDPSHVVPFKNLKDTQILDCNLVKKISCCSLEVDISSNFILNRFQLIAQTNATHTNPGIQSIWNDERLRRQKLIEAAEGDEEKLNAIPSLEIPSTQDRPNVQSTESELFHRRGLLNKLLAMETTVLQSSQISCESPNSSNISNNTTTLNPTCKTLNKQQKRSFNLQKILQNFVYPDECTQNDNLINASFIPNHLSSNSVFEQSLSVGAYDKRCPAEQHVTEDESSFMEDTIIDEDLVLSLSQSHHHKMEKTQSHVPFDATLREEDVELLDILQELEENNEDKIDLDSSLAPLTQAYTNFDLLHQELDKETVAALKQQSIPDSVSENEDETEDNLHDFSIALENLDDLILKLTQSQKVLLSPSHKSAMDLPQVDGVDDLLKTPTKSEKTIGILKKNSSPRTPNTPKNTRLTVESPRRSPRTPKTVYKFAPLPLVSVTRQANKTNTSSETTSAKRNAADLNSLPTHSLRRNLALSDLCRKSVSLDTDVPSRETASAENTRSNRRRTKMCKNLDKTHVTCSLTPRKTSENLLKVYSVKSQDKQINGDNDKLTSEIGNKNNNLEVLLDIDQEQCKKLERLNKSVRKEYVCQYTKMDSSKKDFLNGKKSSQEALYRSEDDEEITESDHEATLSMTDIRRRKSLKRRRQCSIATNSSKRRKTNTNFDSTINSSKFLSMLGTKVDKKSQYILKKCKVKLKRIETGVKNESTIRSEDNTEVADCSSQNNIMKHSNSWEEVQATQVSANEISNQKHHFKLARSAKNITETSSSCQIFDNLQDTLASHLESSATAHLKTVLIKESSNKSITERKTDASPTHTRPYKKSLSLQSPLLFSQNSSPALLKNLEDNVSKAASSVNSLGSKTDITLLSSNNSILSPSTKLIITPLDLPPSRQEVLEGCCKLQLPQYEFQQPFYSNPDDITKNKELGFTILQIPGNKLNDLEAFQSILGSDIKGLTVWRHEQLMRLGGVEILKKYRNTQRIREYFSTQKSVIITPQSTAPNRQEAKLWLKARELLKNQEDLDELKIKNLDEDSPIKVTRQKVTMMLNDGNDNNDDDNNFEYSLRSLKLTPLTPATPLQTQKKRQEDLVQDFTPVTRNEESNNIRNSEYRRKRNNCRVLKRVSLNRQFKECLNEDTISIENNNEDITSDTLKIKPETTVPNSQSSETSVSSETALAELEKSSFVRNLKKSDATISGFSENSTTLDNTFGFKMALENLHQAKADVEFNCLTIVTLEVFVATREDLYPDPELDEIRCLFYAIENNIPNDHINVGEKLPSKSCGYIMVLDNRDVVATEGSIHAINVDIDVTIVQTEVQAIEALLELCSHWDPDIYAGYEIEMSSWGFVIERAKHLCLNIAPLLSRIPTQKVRDFVDEDRESFTDLDVEMKLCGRILLDVWRLLRSEIALTSYTFESVMYHIMHKRCPYHSYSTLTKWFAAPCSRWIVIEYYLERVHGTLKLLDQLDLIGRTSEMAKLIGIQFYEVLSRGSQYRVESMMLRIAKPKNLVPLSPSIQQRAHMRAPEYLPLIMEPQSRFYADPLIVLDFQSLYPSMIIAYNYCFSTCLGRVEHLGHLAPFEFGASQLRVSPAILRKLIDGNLITVSPCGVVFIKSSLREGILPRMLTEILDTRQMVKQSMKLHKSNSALQRILHSRQLGLKLMANVTYGYTAANFSGRMPAVEVGDSVVAKGRETLERAIKMVEDNGEWNVKVVYGDTDSMFVLVPGRNRAEAFRIGAEIAEAVTKQNPHPVKLKLEKVYQPCILQTKKRYVGYMYETIEQKEPIYEAKGIETVRRDGCPMVAKMLEKVLRLLFETADVSQVKRYVCRQFTKLLSGRANLQDLIFAKEFRGLNGYKPTACVPALELTRKWILSDRRRIPRRGERVPFIITNGPPGVPLIRLVRHPHDILADEGLKINAMYYITKAIIPPLNRCLLLIGADVNEWFTSLPRKILLMPTLSSANDIIPCANIKSKKSTISQFFSTTNCVADCGRQTKQGICLECASNSTRTLIILQTKISKIERSYLTTQHICQACCDRVGDLRCASLDCPVLYVLEVKRRDLQQILHYRNLIEERF